MITARSRSIALWSTCFALALCMHGAGAAALLAHWDGSFDSVANAPAIIVDLAPAHVAPETKQSELPPGPQQSEAQPEPDPVKPVEKVELAPMPQAEPLVATMPPQKQQEKPQEKQKQKKLQQLQASLASAPATAEHKAERAAAPAPGASSRDANAVPGWKSLLVATLERNKRYPAQAQERGEHGVAELAFSVDRHGGVHHARILRSSGSSLLDSETMAMLERAAPLPPPPPELAGAEVPIVVPIRYNLR